MYMLTEDEMARLKRVIRVINERRVELEAENQRLRAELAEALDNQCKTYDNAVELRKYLERALARLRSERDEARLMADDAPRA